MVICFALALAASALLFAFLFYFDLSPKSFLRKLTRRLAPRLALTVDRSPAVLYQRISTPSKIPHRPVLLNLETSDGSGQACHPDVLHIPGGFGAESWPYWMACTPYPYGNDALENPELFVSFDGLDWTVPGGLHNPLVPPPPNPGDHHSDPDLVFHDNRLWLFYRETLRSNFKNTRDTNNIHLITSLDGIRWSAPAKVLSDNQGRELLSPAVHHDGSSFVMWTVEIHDAQLVLMRRTSRNAVDWTEPSPCRIAGLAAGRHLWHLDVLAEKDRLSAVLVSYVGLGASGGAGSRLHYAYSEDRGFTWIASGFLLEQIYAFESKLQYRASLLVSPDHPDQYALWYSAANAADVFSIAYLRLVREGHSLVPFVPRAPAPIALTVAQ